MVNAKTRQDEVEACIGALHAARFMVDHFGNDARASERIEEICRSLAVRSKWPDGSSICRNIAEAINRTYRNGQPLSVPD